MNARNCYDPGAMQPSAPELSIVIPAYNEAKRLPSTLQRVCGYLQARNLSAEVLVVDDGSRDATVEVARGFEALGSEDRGVRVLVQPANRGKGAALRAGVLASRGQRVLLCDADMSTPIEEVEKLEAELPRAPLVLGSRAVAESQITERQPFYREFMGKTFNFILRLVGITGLHDTQCGFKLIDGDLARQVFAMMIVDRFAFDVELIWLARRYGRRVVEVGVVWENSPESTVHPIFDSAVMLRDVLRLRWHHRRRPQLPPCAEDGPKQGESE